MADLLLCSDLELNNDVKVKQVSTNNKHLQCLCKLENQGIFGRFKNFHHYWSLVTFKGLIYNVTFKQLILTYTGPDCHKFSITFQPILLPNLGSAKNKSVVICFSPDFKGNAGTILSETNRLNIWAEGYLFPGEILVLEYYAMTYPRFSPTHIMSPSLWTHITDIPSFLHYRGSLRHPYIYKLFVDHDFPQKGIIFNGPGPKSDILVPLGMHGFWNGSYLNNHSLLTLHPIFYALSYCKHYNPDLCPTYLTWIPKKRPLREDPRCSPRITYGQHNLTGSTVLEFVLYLGGLCTNHHGRDVVYKKLVLPRTS